MNSSVNDLKFHPNAAAAAAVIVAVLAGFAELNTGMDKNSALMVWFFFTLCSGFLIQLARRFSYRNLFLLALQPAVSFVIVQLAGAYFYGITEFSAMDYSWNVASILKLLALAAMTAAMIAVVAQAGPLLQVGLQKLAGFTAERAAAVAATIGGIGAIVTAVVVLYKLIVLHQGSAP